MALKTRNNKQWTEARFNSFVKSALRTASLKWPPRFAVLSKAYVTTKINKASGRLAKHYRCNACKDVFPLKDIQVNHKVPVIPTEGFDSWDNTIERLFCEEDGLEALCIPCHKNITKEQNETRKSV